MRRLPAALSGETKNRGSERNRASLYRGPGTDPRFGCASIRAGTSDPILRTSGPPGHGHHGTAQARGLARILPAADECWRSLRPECRGISADRASFATSRATAVAAGGSESGGLPARLNPRPGSGVTVFGALRTSPRAPSFAHPWPPHMPRPAAGGARSGRDSVGHELRGDQSRPDRVRAARRRRGPDASVVRAHGSRSGRASRRPNGDPATGAGWP